MKITVPDKVRWIKDVPDDPISGYSSKQRGRIRSTLKLFEETVDVDILPIDQELVDWFTPLYEERMSTKDNPVIFDVASTTLNNPNGRDYFMMVVSEDGERIGATLFSIMGKQINLVYRTYPNSWKNSSYRANPSLVTDYLITEHAKSIGKVRVSHGKDRNFYGQNAGIGLATFKLSVGCIPKLCKDFELTEVETDDIKEDTLILLSESEGEVITRAVLICHEENAEKFIQLQSYSDQLQVEVLHIK